MDSPASAREHHRASCALGASGASGVPLRAPEQLVHAPGRARHSRRSIAALRGPSPGGPHRWADPRAARRSGKSFPKTWPTTSVPAVGRGRRLPRSTGSWPSSGASSTWRSRMTRASGTRHARLLREGEQPEGAVPCRGRRGAATRRDCTRRLDVGHSGDAHGAAAIRAVPSPLARRYRDALRLLVRNGDFTIFTGPPAMVRLRTAPGAIGARPQAPADADSSAT
jgi:hypothetical protein